ncbi:MAG: response regulator [Pyrinomonadaceae bacterium]
MDRVLIVEDYPMTSKQLRLAITEQIEDVQVDVAMNVAEAREHIERAYKSKQPYQAVVLDMMLPAVSGAPPTLDEKICEAISQKMPNTLVAHITAHVDNESVKQHLEVAHARQVDRSFRLAKEWDYGIELIKKLKPFLYGLRIQEHMNGLFGGGGGGSVLYGLRPRPSLRPRAPRRERSMTHELAALTRDIATYWADLDPGMKLRVEELFQVEEKEGEVTASLL